MMAPGGEDMVDQLMGKVEQLKVRWVDGWASKQAAGMVEWARWVECGHRPADGRWSSGLEGATG